MTFSWIDATGGTNTGLEGDDEYTDAIDIGFSFKFYENSYSQVYISTNGLVTFDGGAYNWSNQSIPNPASPNNFVAPFWDDLCVNYQTYNTGQVYYERGGSYPNRYFAIEWYQVSRLGSGDLLTFEVVLHESGDIVFQYLSLSGALSSATVGTEGGIGLDGLEYLYNAWGLEDQEAVRFYRPAPMARVKTWPLHQGSFIEPGETIVFEQRVRNTGELGSDTYDVLVSSSWDVDLLAADGTTPLTDSDGDGTADTGAVGQGNETSVFTEITAPSSAEIGDGTQVELIFRSSLNTNRQRVVNMKAGVPAPFAQVFGDHANGAMSLDLVRPTSEQVKKVSPDDYYGDYPAIAAAPDGGLAYAWVKYRSDDVSVREIEYTLVTPCGTVSRPLSKLTDHSSATMNTYDYSPAIAVAPNGRIGVMWYRRLYDSSDSSWNYNIYYAILDPSGDVLVPPTNLTNNPLWGSGWAAVDVPRFGEPRIAATTDNRFALAWQRYLYTDDGWVDDIYYAFRDSDGAAVKAITRLTNDTPGYDEGFYYPNLTQLDSGRMLLVWQRGSDTDIYYAVLDNEGDTVKGMTDLSDDDYGSYDWAPDATQVSNGNIVVAWSGAPVSNPGETPWTARYYNNETLTEPAALQRTDDTIDFQWGSGSPHASVDDDYFSVRWTGKIIVTAGAYEFSMGSDDGSRLWIDGQLIMDHWDECCTYWQRTVSLDGGEHDVEMEMHEESGDAWASLSWWAGGGQAIRYAILDGTTYDALGQPIPLTNPAAIIGDGYVSVASDNAGHAILTWMDSNYSYRRNLYYALVDSSGSVLTDPMIFRTIQATDPYIFSSYDGYGNTSLSPCRVYLPLVLKNVFHSPYEPNDYVSEAYGPLVASATYRAYPDDTEDYYYFNLASTKDITVEVTGFTGGQGKLMVYAASDTRNPVSGGYDASGGSTMRVTPSALSPGKYYIRVRTEGSTNTDALYSLKWSVR